MFKFALGARASCKMSACNAPHGYTGYITARTEHLHGCNRYCLNEYTDPDYDLADGKWFDEDDIFVLPEPVCSDLTRRMMTNAPTS